jgi:hypothetical protein
MDRRLIRLPAARVHSSRVRERIVLVQRVQCTAVNQGPGFVFIRLYAIEEIGHVPETGLLPAAA